jgi:hypothetical protein
VDERESGSAGGNIFVVRWWLEASDQINSLVPFRFLKPEEKTSYRTSNQGWF